MKYGQRCVGKNGKIGLKYFAGKCRLFFFHRKVGNYTPNKKFLDNFAETCCVGGKKAIFSEKMHFLARKWHFFQKNILFKIDQWWKLLNMHMPKKQFQKKNNEFAIFTRFYLLIVQFSERALPRLSSVCFAAWLDLM